MKKERLCERIRLNAEQRISFDPETPRSERLPRYKEFLDLEHEALHDYHRKEKSGLAVTQARAMLVDILIENLFQSGWEIAKKASGNQTYEIALLALGGYGRGELSPFSDVDILFLSRSRISSSKLKKFQSVFLEEVLYPLWDLGFNVGHASRSIRETVQEAKRDLHTKNAQLEVRLICGSKSVFKRFQKTYKNYYRSKNSLNYIKQCQEDRAERRAYYGDTVFLQEPDIKNGVGGLRDYQNVLWMARVQLNVERPDALVTQNYLTRKELNAFSQAYDFLLRTRNELHFQSKQPTDLLNLEKQPSVAYNLGYKEDDIFRRVESFMKDYYTHANTIYKTSTLLERSIHLRSTKRLSFKTVLKAYRNQREQFIDTFLLKGDTLYAEDKNVFVDDPVRLVRIFRYSQQFKAKLDFDLIRLIKESLPLITDTVIQSAAANKSFRSILQSVGEVYPTLSQMHDLGVLGRFMPEFERLNCLVQHEYYHRYTADIHVLSTLQELDNIFTQPDRVTEKYRNELRKTEFPSLLYLILLLHDIGKADGIKDHAARGAIIAKPILNRLGIPIPEQERVLFLITHHLEMIRFWQRHDTEDVKTSAAFAKFIGNTDSLRYLYVLTFCDARGTASGLWNDYKDILHTQLFNNTLEQFSDREQVELKNEETKLFTRTEILENTALPISKEEIEAQLQLFPEAYLIHNSATEVRLHLLMIYQLRKKNDQKGMGKRRMPVVDWKEDLNQSLIVVNVVTWDREGLFYKLAGAFSGAELNILNAKAISRSDGVTIDTFYLVDPKGGTSKSKKAQKVFDRYLHEALIEGVDLLPKIIAEAQKNNQTFSAPNRNRLKAAFPSRVDVYHDSSLDRTIVEVQANDHIGLLYQLSRAISQQGFNITFARIATELGVALDTFYIENKNTDMSDATAKLLSLREGLNTIVVEGEAVVDPRVRT